MRSASRIGFTKSYYVANQSRPRSKRRSYDALWIFGRVIGILKKLVSTCSADGLLNPPKPP